MNEVIEDEKANRENVCMSCVESPKRLARDSSQTLDRLGFCSSSGKLLLVELTKPESVCPLGKW